MPRKNKIINFLPYVILAIALYSLMFSGTGSASTTVTYDEFMNTIETENIEEAVISVDYNVISVKASYESEQGREIIVASKIPGTQIDEITDILNADDAKIQIVDANESNIWLDLLGTLLPIVVFGAFAVYLLSKMNGGSNAKAFEFSKSKNFSFIRLDMRNSSLVTKDTNNVVGYGSWMLYEGEKNNFIKKCK